MLLSPVNNPFFHCFLSYFLILLIFSSLFYNIINFFLTLHHHYHQPSSVQCWKIAFSNIFHFPFYDISVLHHAPVNGVIFTFHLVFCLSWKFLVVNVLHFCPTLKVACPIHDFNLNINKSTFNLSLSP